MAAPRRAATAFAALLLLALLASTAVTHTRAADYEVMVATRTSDDSASGSWFNVFNGTDLQETGVFFGPADGAVQKIGAVTFYRGKVVVGGWFSTVSGISTNSLAVWDPKTRLFSAFPGGTGVGIWQNGARGLGFISALYVWNGLLYMGGWFSNINEVAATNIASWDGIKARPLGTGGLFGDPPNFSDFDKSRVYNLIAYGGSLYATGTFTFAGAFSGNGLASDIALNYVGRWDGVQWSPLAGVGIAVNGGWFPNNRGETWYGHSARFTNGTRQIFIVSGDLPASRSAVVMGGNLVFADGMPYFSYVSNNVATLVSQLYPSQDGTRVYAVGGFSTISVIGVYSGTRPLQLTWPSVATTTDGGRTWSAFGNNLGNTQGTYDSINGITEYGGELYIGGRFLSNTTGVQQFAKWNSTSSTWVQLRYAYAYPSVASSNSVNQIKTLSTFTVRDYGCPTILDRLVANNNTRVFAALINATSASIAYHLLTDPAGTRTVFAPTNAAMAGLTFATNAAISAFVLQHIVEGVAVPYSTPTLATTMLFSALYNTTTLKLGQTQARPLSVSATRNGGPVVVFGATGVANDTASVTVDPRTNACTGHYLHTINRAFVAPSNVVTQLTNIGATEFVAALTAANLVSTFSTTAAITVFAPTNAAFNAMSPGWRNLNSTSLLRLLKMHIVSSLLYVSDIGNQTLATSSSFSIDTVSVPRTNTPAVTLRAALNGTMARSTVTGENIFASNGVIHVIDKVLLPWRLYAFTKPFTIPTKVNGTSLSSANISVSNKDCMVQQPTGVMAGGYTVLNGTTPLCCMTRGVIDRTKNPVVMSVGCDLGTTSSSAFFVAPNRASSYAYTNCYSTAVETTQPSTTVIDAAAHVAQGSLDASSSYGNNATSVKRSATIVTSTVTDGAYPFTIAGTSRRRATSTVYCTGKGTLAVGTPSTCVMNICNQSTTNFIVVDLASATDGSVCYHTCYQ